MNKREQLEQMFGNLIADKFCHYFSEGKWSLHDLLAYLLEFTGPSNVYISTYGISESSVREFLRLKEAGQTKKLVCLLDFSVKAQKGGLLFFANNVATDVRLAANHSKLILIEGDKTCITVITSANFTVNPRYECGYISTDISMFKSFLNNYKKAFEKALPVNYE